VERATFEERLAIAARFAVQFGRDFVRQPLPDEFALLVKPNCSYDGNPRRGDEEVFPEESLPDGCRHGPWSVAEAVAFLWRAGKVPEWIDLHVVAEDGVRALIELECCGRFSADEELIYPYGGWSPFQVGSPRPPLGWQSLEVSGRFDLYWQKLADVRPVDPMTPTVAELLAALDAYQTTLYPPASVHLVPAAALAAPGATFLGAFVAEQLVGCGGYVNHAGAYGELKRMFVHPAARGSGIGRRLLAALEAHAAASGLSVLRLETGIRQPEVIRLYERAGYTRRGPFGAYSADPLSVFMEKRLDAEHTAAPDPAT
jgi:putative acetyltransferase